MPNVQQHFIFYDFLIRESKEGVAVIVSEMEHHSNLLPWREVAGAKERMLI